jgi:transmembrane sensor
MKQARDKDGTTQMSATDWVVRLSGEPMENDWLAFEAWLNSAPAHRPAYDKAMTLWLDIDRQAEPLATALAVRDSRARRGGPALWWGGAITAGCAVALTFAALQSGPVQQAAYATAKGERRAVVLSDGTHVALNSDTKITVRLERGRRDITLTQGEAAFDVVHDAKRPFRVKVGDETLRDIGTEFNVLRSGGRVTVTVRQGLVEASSARGEGSALNLGPGSRLEHREGADRSMIVKVSADDAFAWRTGRLIYRDRPLSEVAADLNRYGDEHVAVDSRAADLRFSGVLTIDNQPAMLRRLAALLPVASSRHDGVVTLHKLDPTNQ